MATRLARASRLQEAPKRATSCSDHLTGLVFLSSPAPHTLPCRSMDIMEMLQSLWKHMVCPALRSSDVG